MKKTINTIISSILGLAILVGVGFYIVPKFITKKETGWTNFIDKIGLFFANNWIWIVIVLAILVIATITLYFVIKTKRR